MWKDDYRREMEAVTPDGAALERLYALTDGGAPARGPRRLGRRAAAVLAVCAALAVTAAAAGPTVWDLLRGQLGSFAPYAQALEGTALDQGVLVEVVGALTDGYNARVYFTATDRAGGRFNAGTLVDAALEGEGMGGGRLGSGVISFDRERGTLLAYAEVYGMDFEQDAALSVSLFDPSYRCVTSARFAPPESARALKTTTAEGGETVLLPGQNPAESGDCGDFSISSMGFDAAGAFHIRLAYAEGFHGQGLLALPYDGQDEQMGSTLERVALEGGMDFHIGGVGPEDLGEIGSIRVYGTYHGPETPIRGEWRLPLTLERVERRTLDLERTVGGYPVRRLLVSPLGVTVFYGYGSNPGGLFYGDGGVGVVRKDGSAVPLELEISAQTTAQAEEAFSIWSFAEAVELEDIASISILGETVWEMG